MYWKLSCTSEHTYRQNLTIKARPLKFVMRPVNATLALYLTNTERSAMTIINREQLTVATQPSIEHRAVLTLIVDTGMQKHGFSFPIAFLPFVTSEVPSTIGTQNIMSNIGYVIMLMMSSSL